MWIKEIRYYQYRNIEEQTLKLQPGLNILLGDNGQGKTNFIEGIILSLSGRLFRYGAMSDLPLNGQNETLITLLIQNKDSSEVQLHVREGRKSIKLNGKRVSPNQLLLQYPVLLFSPESLNSIKEGAVERRCLIDDFLNLDPQLHFHKLETEYLRVLKSRNKVLKSYAEGNLTKEMAEHWLSSYEKRFIDLATEITNHRIQGIIHIMADFQTLAHKIYPRPVDISVDYLISERQAINWSREEIKDSLKNRLIDLRVAEMATGSTLVGPQKHEIRFLVNQKDSRYFCSQGQQRALILAFKLAQLMYHRRVHDIAPILFLDDVLSELDIQSRANLIEVLEEMEGQIFLTTTDQYLCRDFKSESQKFINVQNGNFSYL